MAQPNDPKAKTPERDGPPESGDLTPHPRYDERIEGDAFEVMQKYQVVTLPPNARLELMKMKLPEAPPELLQDTVPPNGSVKPPPAEAAPEDAVTTDAPVVEGSRSNDTVIIPRVQRQKRLRSVVIGVVCVGVALLAIGFVVTRSGVSDPAASDSGDVQVTPVNAAAEGESSTAPAAPKEPAPAAATSAKGTGKQPPPAPADTGRKPTPAPARPDTASPAATSETRKPTTQSPKPAPAGSARGKEPWIDGL